MKNHYYASGRSVYKPGDFGPVRVDWCWDENSARRRAQELNDQIANRRRWSGLYSNSIDHSLELKEGAR